MILTSISNLFGIGGATVISRAFGKNKYEKAQKASSFSFYGCITISLIYSIIIYIFINDIINALGGNNNLVHEYAKQYLIYSIVLDGVFTSMNNYFSHILRSEGHAFLAGFGIALGGILNIVLDPLFMFLLLKERNEVIATGLATALSNFISLLFYVIILIKNKKQSIISFKFSRKILNKKIIKNILLSGLPACLMTLFENISYAVLEFLISKYGISYQSGLGVAKK